MMKTYNEAQEKLLNDNNYFTLRELNITKDRSSELPLFNIYYDEGDEVFGLQVFGTIMDNPNIKLWIHGHVHNNFDYMIGDTRVICNPRGYEMYQENFEFKPDLEVDI